MDPTSPPANTTTPASPSPGDKAAIAEAALRRLGSPAPKAPNAKEQFEQECVHDVTHLDLNYTN
jgi:hypothetical protein